MGWVAHRGAVRASDMGTTIEPEAIVARIASLEAALAEARENLSRSETEFKLMRNRVFELEQSRAAATEEAARYKEALEFYARPETYASLDYLGRDELVEDMDENRDPGSRARAALGGEPERPIKLRGPGPDGPPKAGEPEEGKDDG